MLNAVRIWILVSTLLVSSGWILSLLHQLNRVGYCVVFAIAAIACLIWQSRKGFRPQTRPAQLLQKLMVRFKRPAPFIFLVLVVMSLVSGILYAPYNSDTNAYRIPRVLHWLGHQQWHWIHTWDMRMDAVTCGYEWIMTPVMLFTHTDRFLFLINWIPFLMLPGLTFCVLRQTGVSPRVAWWWSWLLASGWCYVLQSASVTNDAFPLTYILAAVALALKARETQNSNDLLISLLAAALATGVKQTAIPLVLLWMIASLPQWRLALTRPAMTLIAVVLGFLISAGPTSIANIKYTGNWTGWSAVSTQDLEWNVRLSSPVVGIVGNAFYLPIQNLEPPFFPFSGNWNRLMDRFLNTSLGAHFRSFDHFGGLSPGMSESSAGIGLAIVLMAAISVWAAIRYRGPAHAQYSSPTQHGLRLAPWLLLLIFMAEDGTIENARHLAPYYIFLFPVILIAGGQKLLTRKIWWQRTALICMATGIGLLIVNINRPLFPAATLMARLAASHPHSHSVDLLQEVYGTPTQLENLKSNLLRQLPDEPLLGFAGEGNVESEPILWQPWGSRTVEWVLPQDTPEQLQERGIHFVVIENYPDPSRMPVEAWMKKYHAHLLADIPFKKNGHHNESSHIYITRLDPPGSSLHSSSGVDRWHASRASQTPRHVNANVW